MYNNFKKYFMNPNEGEKLVNKIREILKETKAFAGFAECLTNIRVNEERDEENKSLYFISEIHFINHMTDSELIFTIPCALFKNKNSIYTDVIMYYEDFYNLLNDEYEWRGKY